jgi:hypothetical protein
MSLPIDAAAFAIALGRELAHRARHGLLRGSALADARRAVCAECPQYQSAGDRCKLCGCVVGVKVTFHTAFCPLKKW